MLISSNFINFCYFRGFFPIIWLLWYPIMMMYVYGSFAGVECWFDLLKYTNWLDQLPTISIGRLELVISVCQIFLSKLFPSYPFYGPLILLLLQHRIFFAHDLLMNRRLLESKATTAPTKPQPLLNIFVVYSAKL